MFSSIYVFQYLCFPVSIFSQYLCFLVGLPVFPRTYVSQYLCFPVPKFPSTYIFPVPKFPSTCVSQDLCVPVFMFSRTYVSQDPPYGKTCPGTHRYVTTRLIRAGQNNVQICKAHIMSLFLSFFTKETSGETNKQFIFEESRNKNVSLIL